MPFTTLWDHGVHCGVDRVLEVRQAYSSVAGGCGMRYTVKVEGYPPISTVKGSSGS